MLGYVLDGKVATVQPKIQTAISKHSALVGLTDGPSAIASVGTASRFSSVHLRADSGTSIDIRHALVPCGTTI